WPALARAASLRPLAEDAAHHRRGAAVVADQERAALAVAARGTLPAPACVPGPLEDADDVALAFLGVDQPENMVGVGSRARVAVALAPLADDDGHRPGERLDLLAEGRGDVLARDEVVDVRGGDELVGQVAREVVEQLREVGVVVDPAEDDRLRRPGGANRV